MMCKVVKIAGGGWCKVLIAEGLVPSPTNASFSIQATVNRIEAAEVHATLNYFSHSLPLSPCNIDSFLSS